MPFRAFILVAFAALFFVLPSISGFAVDWLWFGELGFQSVYATSLTSRTLIGVGVFAIAFLWLAGHLRHALRAASGAPSSFTTREGFTIVLPTRDQLRPIGLLAAAAGALLLALVAASEWMTILPWWYQTSFGVSDPILGRDVAFYVFTLPMLELVRGLALALVVLAAIGAAAATSPHEARPAACTRHSTAPRSDTPVRTSAAGRRA